MSRIGVYELITRIWKGEYVYCDAKFVAVRMLRPILGRTSGPKLGRNLLQADACNVETMCLSCVLGKMD